MPLLSPFPQGNNSQNQPFAGPFPLKPAPIGMPGFPKMNYGPLTGARRVPITPQSLTEYGANVLGHPAGMTSMQRMMALADRTRADYQKMMMDKQREFEEARSRSMAEFQSARDRSIAAFRAQRERSRAYFMQHMRMMMDRYRALSQIPDIPPQILNHLRDQIGMRWKTYNELENNVQNYPMVEIVQEAEPAPTAQPATTPVAETAPAATTTTTELAPVAAESTPAATTTTTEPATTTTEIAPSSTPAEPAPAATTTTEPVVETTVTAVPATQPTVYVTANTAAEEVTRSARD